MSELQHFKQCVLDGVTLGHDDSVLTESSWSGFALVEKEGGSLLFSASLKIPVPGDPKSIKPIYQKQPISGFVFHSIEGIQALFNQDIIYRTQLIYKKSTRADVQKQIDLLTKQLATLTL